MAGVVDHGSAGIGSRGEDEPIQLVTLVVFATPNREEFMPTTRWSHAGSTLTVLQARMGEGEVMGGVG